MKRMTLCGLLGLFLLLPAGCVYYDDYDHYGHPPPPPGHEDHDHHHHGGPPHSPPSHHHHHGHGRH